MAFDSLSEGIWKVDPTNFGFIDPFTSIWALLAKSVPTVAGTVKSATLA